MRSYECRFYGREWLEPAPFSAAEKASAKAASLAALAARATANQEAPQ